MGLEACQPSHQSLQNRNEYLVAMVMATFKKWGKEHLPISPGNLNLSDLTAATGVATGVFLTGETLGLAVLVSAGLS